MTDLNYDFILLGGILAYVIFIFPSVIKAFSEPNLYSIAVILVWLLSTALVVTLLDVFCDVHAFCFRLYNALQANGITIEQLMESAK